VSGMGSVERVLVLGIVVVIVAILGITIWGASGSEQGAVLPATDGGVVSTAPLNTDGALADNPVANGTAAPLASGGDAAVMPVNEIERWRALHDAEARDRGVALGNTPAVDGTVAPGTPAAPGSSVTGAVALESTVNATPADGAGSPIVLPLVGPDSAAAKPAAKATPGTYTVVTGDSIWKIAHRTYGDANIQEHIDAILAANPSVDADSLKVGAKLTLPGADGKDVARQSPARQVETMKGSLYEVKKGDTLSSIARAQLGSSTRWKSIYELNRERIQDPASIKVGTTLRLPKN